MGSLSFGKEGSAMAHYLGFKKLLRISKENSLLRLQLCEFSSVQFSPMKKGESY